MNYQCDQSYPYLVPTLAFLQSFMKLQVDRLMGSSSSIMQDSLDWDEDASQELDGVLAVFDELFELPIIVLQPILQLVDDDVVVLQLNLQMCHFLLKSPVQLDVLAFSHCDCLVKIGDLQFEGWDDLFQVWLLVFWAAHLQPQFADLESQCLDCGL